MERTNEDIVTKILSMSEILKRNDTIKTKNNNSEYDLSHYLKIEEKKQQKYMDKYLFVK